MDRLCHLVILDGADRGFDMSDQVRLILLARLGQMGFIPQPLRLAFDTETGFRIIGRIDRQLRRRHIARMAPEEGFFLKIVGSPDLSGIIVKKPSVRVAGNSQSYDSQSRAD